LEHMALASAGPFSITFFVPKSLHMGVSDAQNSRFDPWNFHSNIVVSL